jgi:tetratricopeptide (TPR) repeat protein
MADFDSLWDFNHPEITEQKFRELMPSAESSGNSAYFAELLTQIARAEGLQRKFEDAHKTLDRAEKLITNDMHIPKVRCLLERGRTLNSSGKPQEAKKYFLDAWDLARSSNADGYAVDAAHMVAIVEPPDEALKWNERAIEFAEESEVEDAKKWLGALYNNLGWTYHDKKDYEKALDYFERDFKWYSERNRPVQARIAQWSIARTLRSQKKTQQALDIQRTLLRQIEVNKEDPDGYVFEEIAECLQELGREEEARPYFGKAHELLSKDIWLTSNEAPRLERLKNLSK